MCVKLAQVGINVFDRAGKAKSHPGRQVSYHTVVWQRHCRKVTFGLVGPTHIALAGICATWLHSQGRQKTIRGGVAKESIHACKGVS